MKIEIHKVNGKSQILLDGKPVATGCKGFEISSEGAGGFATVTLKFFTKDLDFAAEVDDLTSHRVAGKKNGFCYIPE